MIIPFTITYEGIEKSKKTNVKLTAISKMSTTHESIASINEVRFSFVATPIDRIDGITIVKNAPIVIAHLTLS